MFGLTKEEIMSIMEPKNFIGRSKEQVEEFLEKYINPVIEKNKDILNMKSELTV
jgi:adenylosuccinate lyase